MKPLREVLAAGDRDELEQQKYLRDELVQQLRAEMLLIHDALEPHWLRDQALASGPEHLAQKIDKKGK